MQRVTVLRDGGSASVAQTSQTAQVLGAMHTVLASQGGGGGTSDYEALDNKPSIEGVTLVGDKPLSTWGTLASNIDVLALFN